MTKTTLGQEIITDNLDLLLEVLPPHLREHLTAQPDLDMLLEVVLDLGRQPEARYPGRVAALSEEPVAADDLDYVVHRVGRFGDDNRAGIERTLHRISAIRNRAGKVVGLTLRVGRSVYGTIDIIRDIVEQGKSILLLGRPGIGKTTKLREVARVLADDFGKRVVVVDTSNEIAGDGDIPHPGIGRARRMQVPRSDLQHRVMIEAVENHMPEVIVIDEIGTEAEALAARTIAERGVQLIATAHGNTLENLLMNPTLEDLVGGIHAVTLSDEEARRRGTQKTVLERKAPPTFDTLIEITEIDRLAIHHDVADAVDRLLRGGAPQAEIRTRNPDGSVEVVSASRAPEDLLEEMELGPEHVFAPRPLGRNQTLRIFPYGVNRGKIERALRDLGLQAEIVRFWEEADAVIALKAHQRRDAQKLKEATAHGIPVYIIRANTQLQILGALRETSRSMHLSVEQGALREARQAIEEVLATSRPAELSPQNAYLRRLQHQLAEKYDLSSESVGIEPRRRVRIFK